MITLLRRRQRQQAIAVTSEDSWDLLLRGLEGVCIRINGEQELIVDHFDDRTDNLYGRPWVEAENDWTGPEMQINALTIRSIHIL